MWQILAHAVTSPGSTERAITSEKTGSLAPRQAADEHLSVDLEHGDVVSKGMVLGRARQACTQHPVPGHAGFE